MLVDTKEGLRVAVCTGSALVVRGIDAVGDDDVVEDALVSEMLAEDVVDTASTVAVEDGLGVVSPRTAGRVAPGSRPSLGNTHSVPPLASGVHSLFSGQQKPLPQSFGAMIGQLSLCLSTSLWFMSLPCVPRNMVKARCHAMPIHLGPQGGRTRRNSENRRRRSGVYLDTDQSGRPSQL